MKHCSHCGALMPSVQFWPRQCSSCEREHFRNPIPVCVVLLPVGEGVLTVRRAIPPGKGLLALPGGFVNWGESWREAGAREVFEETGVIVAPENLELLAAESVNEGVILLFAKAEPKELNELQFKLCPDEISEAVVVTEACELAFETHTQVLRAYFDGTSPERAVSKA